jgi:hypothetical protein
MSAESTERDESLLEFNQRARSANILKTAERLGTSRTRGERVDEARAARWHEAEREVFINSLSYGPAGLSARS